MITVEVTTTNYIVSATEATYNVTVSADNTLFTITNVTPSFTVTNVTPLITFTADGTGFDFVQKNRGAWVSGERYYRNDVVYYQYSTYICAVDPLSYVESATPPLTDTTNWELFIFNEWPRAYLTVTNWLNVGSTATIGGPLVVNNSATITGTLAVSTSTTIGGNLSVNGNFNLAGSITAANGTFTNSLRVGGATSGTFYINGLQYPRDKGTYGQVLYTNGTTDAAWVNLGELTFWELSEDLKTEGFNIVSNGVGNQLTVGGGQTGNFHNSIKFNTVANGSDIDVHGTTNFDDNVNITGNVVIQGGVTMQNKLRVNDVLGIEGWTGSTATFVKVNTGIKFPDGTTQTSAFSLPVASIYQLGGIKVGDGLYMGLGIRSQYLNVSTATTATIGGVIVGEYLSINTGTAVLTVNTTTLAAAIGQSSYTLPIATNSTLGGIRVGPTLDINTTTGVLNADYATTASVGVVQVGEFLSVTTDTAIVSVNTATLMPYIAQFGIPIASDSILGGIRVGDFLTINSSTGVMSINTATLAPALVDLSIPIASETVLGGVRVADSSTIDINTTTGDISVPIATGVVLGVVKVGTGLSIDGGGTLRLSSGNSYGDISLTEDMETNGYSIRRGSILPNANVKMFLDTNKAVLQGGTVGVDVTVTTSTVEINTLNTTTNSIQLKSPIIVAGYDIYNSKVQASSYYNFEGTGAAFFPANIKFSDDTIQRTAWRGYDQGLI
jgi:hypothetical protein